MGDVLMSTPAYAEIIQHFPNAELLTIPESKKIGERYFDKVHTSWSDVWKEDYDIAIHLHTSFFTNFMLWLNRIPIRLGYSYKLCGFLLTHKIDIKTRTLRSQYRPDEVCDLLEQGFGWWIEDRKVFWL